MLFAPLRDRIVALSLDQVVGKLGVPPVAQLVGALADILRVDHVALELAGHVDLAHHVLADADVDLDAAILLDGGRIDGGGGVHRAALLEQVDQRLGVLRLYLEHLAPRYTRVARHQVYVLVLVCRLAQRQLGPKLLYCLNFLLARQTDGIFGWCKSAHESILESKTFVGSPTGGSQGGPHEPVDSDDSAC